MDYEKKYNEALERARENYELKKTMGLLATADTIEAIFPELRESYDERIRKEMIQHFQNILKGGADTTTREDTKRWLAYLEKQKDAIPYEKYVEDIAAIHAEARTKYHEGWNDGYEARQVINAVGDSGHQAGYAVAKKEMKPKVATATLDSEKQKEQKPISTEDMPYITDEHFWEREPADSFKYKLAEYMTKNSRKEESPDGYTYHISAETILKMAEEELLKRGVVQKSAEWNANDKAFIKDCAHILDENGYAASAERLLSMFPVKPAEWSEEDEEHRQNCLKVIKMKLDEKPYPYYEDYLWLKSLCPQPKWKPSEAQMKAFGNSIESIPNEYYDDMCELYADLKKLMEE